MKKVTRLLILAAFVLPLAFVSRAYAGGPGPGHRINFGDRSRLGLEPFGAQQTDGLNQNNRDEDGWRATMPDNNPLHLEDPIGNPHPDINRNDLFNRSIMAGHDRFPGAGHPAWDPANSGGGGATAPIDGGISLLLAAGIGLGMKRAKARKQAV